MKLNHLLTIAFCFMCSSALFAQYPGDSLKVTLQGPLLFAGNDAKCDLTGETKVYMHSGVGNDAAPFSTVTGNWGMDDGVGEMSPTGNADEWTITIDVETYYTGADAASDTAMGVVFRSADGMKEGKDSACMDIFVRQLNSATPTVEGSSGNAFTHVAVEWIGATGIGNVNNNISTANAYPNPVLDKTTITYSLSSKAENVSIKIYNALGSEIATLVDEQSKPIGSYRAIWDGNDQSGDLVDSGVYFYVIKADQSVLTNRMMVVR